MPRWRRPDAGVAAALRVASCERATSRGNPPSLRSNGFLPREIGGEAGFEPGADGLPKCATDCPGVDWLVGFWPREITGIPLGSPVAKVGHSDFIFPSGEAVVEA